VTLRAEEAEVPRRCWRSGFVRLASPMAEEPVPLGVAWLFQDITATKRAEQENSLLRFRAQQLHRAGRAAADCPDPAEAAAVHLDFALAGFADHGLVDLATTPAPAPFGAVAEGDALDAYETEGAVGAESAAGVAGGAKPASGAGDSAATGTDTGPRTPAGTPRLVRALASPAGSPGPSGTPAATGIPVPYVPGHPAIQAYERRGSVRTSAGPASPEGWAAARRWPDGTVHGLCVVLCSRGRRLGVATFLRAPARRPFDRADADYAEEVAARIAAALDLAGAASR
jgi:hypothetical protein